MHLRHDIFHTVRELDLLNFLNISYPPRTGHDYDDLL